MNIKRRIIGGAVLASVATVAAVVTLPDAELVQHVVPLMKFGLAAIVLLTGVSVYLEGRLDDMEKSLLMNGFLIAILLPSFYAAGAFVHESETSWTGGEVHWHADFEILAENDQGELEEINLIDPGQFCEETEHESSYMCDINDRTGSTEYHEHNDDRIHLEGTFNKRGDATLSAFFEQFYGELSNERLVVPTNDGERVFENNGKTVKILVQKGTGPNRHWCMVNGNIDEEEVCESHGIVANSPSRYIVSPHTQGPTLDTIFIVHDSLSPEEALENVREDNEYRGHGLTKEGSGYGS